jgi:hypothetical protein
VKELILLEGRRDCLDGVHGICGAGGTGVDRVDGGLAVFDLGVALVIAAAVNGGGIDVVAAENEGRRRRHRGKKEGLGGKHGARWIQSLIGVIVS